MLAILVAVLGVAFVAACPGDAAAQASAREGGARGEAQAVPAISQAAHSGDIDAVEQLLSAGSDVNAVSAEGTTPLMESFQPHIGPPSKIYGADHAAFRASQARKKRKLRIAQLLLDRGADLARVDRYGMTALHYLVLMYADERALVDILQVFMAKGADPNVANNDGTTPLIFAAYRNRPQLAKSLLAAGADPNAAAKDGHTALSIARERGYTELAGLLTRGKR